MKKYIIIFLISIFLLFNLTFSIFAVNIFKEGVYKAADFNFSPNNAHIVQNVSSKDSIYILLFDENQRQIQSIRLDPKSEKYNLLPLKPNYRIVILGNGEVFID
ncbi:hypothetical protein [Clostridium butyricum]|jgi:hypothetical protein|uniref:Uncharacterized protein n=1 Tax=Clostridium butyricum TaxID=1492 RepID=A0AAP9RDY2_CLOBU|nr:hypothetical protein [Clostridium butyricum]MBZ5745628.1 hypothetical protein [Clostridium butyricum]MDI9209542.1 hypothetical protein [Clostridium butyricum]QMW90555.1 hypothetical protein FF104_06160 [Clostridium butyricum]BBK77333.1 hypothetical protein Cbu04g_23410 [Clostridium butyricum]GEQ24331.1 hypothetical protein CBU03nite_07540 [Clostridium butyricum]